jgi:hypothetical protein
MLLPFGISYPDLHAKAISLKSICMSYLMSPGLWGMVISSLAV